ncbi:DUF5522 domain-containing protein [Ohtaekwangia koreensis]|uniref:Uncharacterized protein n=1 Tax=Ohtaekwangia koreensis TaxID=688867 RepID=A0A1T5IM03_9BACT|nr:DUF5522 domain-containing protein [Ohtaekwangia koreensis]SKC40165.1 hypothetical protein SAMN05660236_0162 [Ohtaekwangia koreensis]
MANTDKSEREDDFKDSIYHYMENGLIVFTEAFHLKRGYCCKSGCRHCPYGFKKGKGDKAEKE